MKLALALVIAAALVALPAGASEWRWSYQGDRVAASGVFTTPGSTVAGGSRRHNPLRHRGFRSGVPYEGVWDSFLEDPSHPIGTVVLVLTRSFPASVSGGKAMTPGIRSWRRPVRSRRLILVPF